MDKKMSIGIGIGILLLLSISIELVAGKREDTIVNGSWNDNLKIWESKPSSSVNDLWFNNSTIAWEHALNSITLEVSASFIILNDSGTIKSFYGNGTLYNSSSNAAALIQNTLDSLTPGRTWKEKVILNGNFTLNSAISVPSYTILDLSQAYIKAADGLYGDGTINGLFYNSNAKIIPNVGNTQIEIIGGIIDGNKANSGADNVAKYQSGIMMRFITDSIFKNITIINFKTFGIFITRGAGSGTFINQSENVSLDSLSVENCDWDNIAITGDKIKILNCRSSGSGRCGITLEESRYCQVIGGNFLNNTEYGVEATADGYGHEFIRINSCGNGYGGFATSFVYDILVKGCFAIDNNLGTTGNHGYYGTSVHDLILERNFFKENNGWGIRITGGNNSYKIVLIGNDIQNNTQGQVYLDVNTTVSSPVPTPSPTPTTTVVPPTTLTPTSSSTPTTIPTSTLTPITSSQSSSGDSYSIEGARGGIGIGEPYENIAAKEVSYIWSINSRENITKKMEGKHSIVELDFKYQTSAGETIIIVEKLKNRSIFTNNSPPGVVYEYLNVWVNLPSSKYLENVNIKFQVEKRWLETNQINANQIVLYRFNEGTWNKLPTHITSENNATIFYSSQSPGFSPFAIVAEKKGLPKSKINYELKLQEGWNFISFPILNDTLSAKSIAALSNNQITKVLMLNTTTKEFVTYIIGLSEDDENFAIKPNIGYYVYTIGSTSFSIEGFQPENETIKLNKGWNAIGWPFYLTHTINISHEMSDKIKYIVTFDENLKQYQTYVVGFSDWVDNFVPESGRGYLIYANYDCELR
jgi:PGF-pre-PGF domain-containing protein